MTTREAFEEWVKKNHPFGNLVGKADAREMFPDYWLAWQAATAAALAAPATAPEPSWHDAPTVPGLWVVDEKLWRITKPELHEGSEDRWLGPLPEDKP